MIHRQINKLVRLYKIEVTVTIINLALISTSAFIEYEKYKQRDKVGDKIIYDGKDRLVKQEGYANSYIVDDKTDINDY